MTTNFKLSNLLREIIREKRRAILAGIGISIFTKSFSTNIDIKTLTFNLIELTTINKSDREEIIFYAEKFKTAREKAYVVTKFSNIESLDSINGEDNVLGKELAKNIEDNIELFRDASLYTSLLLKNIESESNDG